MDLTSDSSTVITVGTTGKDRSGRAEALVSALQFNRSLKMIGEIIIDRFNAQAATAIKRIPSSNDFLVGCFKHIFILGFSGTSFTMLGMVENVHPSNINLLILDIIYDICVFGNTVYSVGKKDNVVAVTRFPQLL